MLKPNYFALILHSFQYLVVHMILISTFHISAEVSVPEYWEPQPKEANGKELVVHLVTLNPNDPNHKDEFKKISDHFQQTASQQKILQIQRVQNPSLFKLYRLKKQSLDNKNGSNEKFLFHGTKGDSLHEINKAGLNRNFAGTINGNVSRILITMNFFLT